MKFFLVGTMFLGFASLGYSQSSDCRESEIRLSGIEVTALDQMYLDKVSEGINSAKVYALEKRASRYNIRENSIFYDNPKRIYEVRFFVDGGKIVAIYDHKGKILYAREKYQDLTLPFEIRNSVYRENPDWDLHSTTYTVTYDGRSAKKIYLVKIKKEGLKKNLKFDAEGNRLN